MRAAFEAVGAAKIRSHATGHARHHFADAGSYMQCYAASLHHICAHITSAHLSFVA